MIGIVIFSSGCALSVWSRLKEGVYKDGARDFKTTVPAEWMRLNLVNYFSMTRDGVALEKIAVERLRFKDKLESTKKKFSEDMSAQDLADVEIDNFKADENIQNFELQSNVPYVVAGQPGFRLEYRYATVNGLSVSGIHCGFAYKKWVYRIRYEAASQHYFDKYRQDFDRFLQDFQLL